MESGIRIETVGRSFVRQSAGGVSLRTHFAGIRSLKKLEGRHFRSVMLYYLFLTLSSTRLASLVQTDELSGMNRESQRERVPFQDT